MAKKTYSEKYKKGVVIENQTVVDIIKSKGIFDKFNASIEIKERSVFSDKSETMVIEIKLTEK